MPWIFSIAELTNTCLQLDINYDGHEKLLIWFYDICNWKQFMPQDKISYADNLKAILIRREGVENCPGLCEGAARLFN